MASPHIERVITEKSELDAKLEKLEVFIRGPIFSGLHSDEQNDMLNQIAIMNAYSKILESRIARAEAA